MYENYKKKWKKMQKNRQKTRFWFILVHFGSFWFTFRTFQKNALQVICKKNIPFFENGKALLSEKKKFKKTANFNV